MVANIFKNRKMWLVACCLSLVTFGLLVGNNIRLQGEAAQTELYQTFLQIFPEGTNRKTVEEILKNKDYDLSSMHMADTYGDASTAWVSISDKWNENNYYVDYDRKTNFFDHLDFSPLESHFTKGLRVLYDSDQDTVLEIHLRVFRQDKLGTGIWLWHPEQKTKFIVLPMQNGLPAKRDGKANEPMGSE